MANSTAVLSRSTISAAFYCKKCRKQTQHRIDGGRKGPCLECAAKTDAEYERLGQGPQQFSLPLSGEKTP